MVVCPKCGSQNDSDAIFCEKCGTRLNPEKSKKKMTKNKYLVIGAIAICAVVGLIYYLNLDPTFDNGNISFTYPKGYVIEETTDSEVKLHNPSSDYNITVFKTSNSGSSLQKDIEFVKMWRESEGINEYFSDEKEISIDGTTGYQFDTDSYIETGAISTFVVMEKNGYSYIIFNSKRKNASIPESTEKSSFDSSKTNFENTVVKTFHVK